MRTRAIGVAVTNSPSIAEHIEPRESMRVLPGWLQPFLTWLTGKPLAGQRPWRLKPGHHLAASILPLLTGIGASIAVIEAGGPYLVALLVCWLLTTHGVRKLRTMILHQCSHGNYLGRKRIDTLLGEAIAILVVSQDYEDYKREHVGDHHSSSHMTMKDPTAQFVINTMMCCTDMTRAELWRRLLLTAISPGYHARALSGRFLSHWHRSSPGHVVAFVAALMIQGGLVYVTGSWMTYLLAWVVPLSILFNVSALLRLACRHVFPPMGQVRKGRAAVAGYTHGIFLGDPVPTAVQSRPRAVTSWSLWWFRLFFVHVPARLFVLVGDGPCHDYHHRYPRSKNWANYPFARADDLAAGHPGWPPYTEVWGLRAAIDAVFASLRRADPQIYGSRSTGRAAMSVKDLVAAIEE